MEKSLPESFIDPALARTLHIERMLGVVAKAVDTIMADIEVANGIAEEEGRLGELRESLGRIGVLSENLAASLADEPAEATLPVDSSPDNGYTSPAPDALTPIHSLTGDKVNEPLDDELGSAIISIDKIPPVSLDEGDEPISVVIIDDNCLVINGHEVTLERDQIFIFNALLMELGQPVSGGYIRKLGFRPGMLPKNAVKPFLRETARLLTNLNEATGIDAITRIGKKGSTRYIASKLLQLQDERGQRAPELEEIVKKN